MVCRFLSGAFHYVFVGSDPAKVVLEVSMLNQSSVLFSLKQRFPELASAFLVASCLLVLARHWENHVFLGTSLAVGCLVTLAISAGGRICSSRGNNSAGPQALRTLAYLSSLPMEPVTQGDCGKVTPEQNGPDHPAFQILASVEAPACVCDLIGRITMRNSEFTGQFELNDGEEIPGNLLYLIPPADSVKVREALIIAWNRGAHSFEETRWGENSECSRHLWTVRKIRHGDQPPHLFVCCRKINGAEARRAA